MSQYIAHDRHADAVQIANRSLKIDSLHEGAHRVLIQVHQAQGRYSLARNQYEEYREILANELSVGTIFSFLNFRIVPNQLKTQMDTQSSNATQNQVGERMCLTP